MIKDNQKKLNGFHVVLDGLIIIASYALAWFILLMGNRLFSPEKKLLAPQYYFAALIIIVPGYLRHIPSLCSEAGAAEAI